MVRDKYGDKNPHIFSMPVRRVQILMFFNIFQTMRILKDIRKLL